MSQLTNEEKAKVFSMYHPLRIIDVSVKYERILSNSYAIQLMNHEVICHEYDNAKLVLELTPLSSITDDDAIEVAKIHLPIFYNDEFEFETRREVKDKLFVIVFRKGVFYEKIPIQLYSCSPLVFQYLVSKSYAVPLFFGINHCANGKTAIELGIAIDKNKQNG